MRSKFLNVLHGALEQLQAFLKVDDINAVALSEDVFLHLGIPALGLVAEVDTSLQKLLHGDGNQTDLLDLPLGELEPLASSLLTVFLALFDPGVTRQ